MASDRNEIDSLLFEFGFGEANVVNLNEDYEDGSDGTLLGDEFEERFVRPTPDVIFVRETRTNEPHHDNGQDGKEILESYSSGGHTFKSGKTVELGDGDFLRISAVIHELLTDVISFQGLLFRRNRELRGLLPLKMNEVTMLLSFDEHDPRDLYHQSLVIVSLDEVVRLRELVLANLPFPGHSFREIDPTWQRQGQDFVVNHGRLVCRTQQLLVSKNEGSIQVLRFNDIDKGYGQEDERLRHRFRGETKKGGACKHWLEGERSFDRNERARCGGIDLLQFHRQIRLNSDQDKPRYSFADGFCGAGGASRGAKETGLRVEWGFDYDPAAIDSYKRNFYGTRCEQIPVHEFVTILTENFKVDILHLSPPCQPFSLAHAKPGKNDELNQATFLAIEEVLVKIKPRIVTLEETFGLTAKVDALPWFGAMVQMFTKLGFSIRWKVFNLCDFGLPQPRKRLFIFASW